MDAIKVDATLEERTSKSGNKYKCIIIKISKNIEKIVFLEPAELELLEQNNKNPFAK